MRYEIVGSQGVAAMDKAATSIHQMDVPEPDASGVGLRSADSGSFLDLEVCGIALAAVSLDGRPIVGKGAGCVVDGRRLRITTRQIANEVLLRAIAQGSPIAATFSRPTTHGSIQFKARSARLDDPGSDDFLAAQRQRELFSTELIASAYPEPFTERYTAFAPHELVVVEFDPDETYDQTPGPAAGARLR